MFPLSASGVDPAAATALVLALDIGVCAEICVPEHYDLTLDRRAWRIRYRCRGHACRRPRDACRRSRARDIRGRRRRARRRHRQTAGLRHRCRRSRYRRCRNLRRRAGRLVSGAARPGFGRTETRAIYMSSSAGSAPRRRLAATHSGSPSFRLAARSSKRDARLSRETRLFQLSAGISSRNFEKADHDHGRRKTSRRTFRVKDDEGKVRRFRSAELFAGKKVVLVGVPGAFTSTCHKAHIPVFRRKRRAIKAKGVDRIAVVAVNDHHVMKAWGETLGGRRKIDFLADGSADLPRRSALDIDARP